MAAAGAGQDGCSSSAARIADKKAVVPIMTRFPDFHSAELFSVCGAARALFSTFLKAESRERFSSLAHDCSFVATTSMFALRRCDTKASSGHRMDVASD